MRIILWGAGQDGKKIHQFLREGNYKIDIVGWVDANPELSGQKVLDLPVYALGELKEIIEKEQIDEVVTTLHPFTYLHEIRQQSIELGITNVSYVPRYLLMEEYVDLSKPPFVPILFEKFHMHYFEVHLADHCNLNCQGCGHISNACEPWMPTLESYVRDIERLKELVGAVAMIKFFGGETLLNPELPKFIVASRKVFPDAELYVGTNGLLIPSLEEETLRVMHDNKVYFTVSGYEPMFRILNEIEKRLKRYHVPFVVGREVKVFWKRFMLHSVNNPVESYKKCISLSGRCFGLREGKISPCSSFYVRMLNEKFNAGIKLTPEDEFDLYKDDAADLEKLYEPIPLCAYCGNPMEFPWKRGVVDAKLEDYVIMGEDEEKYRIR